MHLSAVLMDFRKTRGHPFSASLQCIHGHSRPISLLPLPRLGTCTPSATPLTCYGAELPYSSSGPSLLSTNTSLEAWAGLQELPAGWALVQQILCAGLTPSCSQGRVTKVPRAY